MTTVNERGGYRLFILKLSNLRVWDTNVFADDKNISREAEFILQQ